MPTIVEGNDWKTDHESNLDWENMRALIGRIVSEVPGMNDPPDTAAVEFRSLSLVLRDQKNGVVFLSKGIHQEDELHYNLTCVAAGGQSEFHVYIGKGAAVEVSTKPLADKHYNRVEGVVGQAAKVPFYRYKNVGITWRQHGSAPLLFFPPVFSKNAYPGRQRGNSFCAGNSAAVKARGPTSVERNAIIAAVKKASASTSAGQTNG